MEVEPSSEVVAIILTTNILKGEIREIEMTKELLKTTFKILKKYQRMRDGEETSEDRKRLQNIGDPLSFVLGESDDEEELGEYWVTL